MQVIQEPPYLECLKNPVFPKHTKVSCMTVNQLCYLKEYNEAVI